MQGTAGNFSHTKLMNHEIKQSSRNKGKKSKDKNNKVYPGSGSQLTSASMSDKSIKVSSQAWAGHDID